MIRHSPRVPLLAAIAAGIVVACSADPDSSSGVDTGTDADLADSGADDTGATAPQDSGGPEVDANTASPIPDPSHPGPCRRDVFIGSGAEPFYVYRFDYSESPSRVVALRESGGEVDFSITFDDIDFQRRCDRPPEDAHAPFVAFVGCPRRVTLDASDNGLISPQDFRVEYTYDAAARLLAADRFDWRGTFVNSAWFYEYARNGALVGGRRVDNDATAIVAHFDYADTEGLVVGLDEGDDGSLDYETTYEFDAEGNLLVATQHRADPSSGRLEPASVSRFSYDCWD